MSANPQSSSKGRRPSWRYRLRRPALWLNRWTVERWFDCWFGVETGQLVPLGGLTIPRGDRSLGNHYEPTRVLGLWWLFRALRPLCPPGGAFVDLGCGKGRVLLLASGAGFNVLRWVEFARELCEVARRNCAIYKARRGLACEFQVLEGDVAQFAICAEDQVFFLFNPFGAPVLQQVLDNLSASVRAQPRRVLLVYANPVHQELVQAQSWLHKVLDQSAMGHHFVVYSNEI